MKNMTNPLNPGSRISSNKPKIPSSNPRVPSYNNMSSLKSMNPNRPGLNLNTDPNMPQPLVSYPYNQRPSKKR